MLLPVLSRAAALAGLAAAAEEPDFSPRSFNGSGNNVNNPEWGAAGTSQVRQVCVLRLHVIIIPFALRQLQIVGMLFKYVFLLKQESPWSNHQPQQNKSDGRPRRTRRVFFE